MLTATMDGDQRKQMGLFHVEQTQQVFLETMRSQARMVCRRQGFVTSDDLREFADSQNMAPRHKNAWGGVFRNGEFKCSGYVKSRWRSNNSRLIRQWILA